MPADLVLEVLGADPRIYHSSHREHPRARPNLGRLSARDAFILGHLDTTRPIGPAALARHLSLRESTISEAIKEASVPDAGRVGRLLEQPSKTDRAAAVRGLLLLAAAARSLNEKEPKRWEKGGP